MTRVLVAGALAHKPYNGGEAWVRLSWVRGLARLGCDVHFVEQIATGHCVDRTGAPAPFAESVNRRYFVETIARFGLERHATLLVENGRESVGLTRDELNELAAESDLLVNISGHLTGPIQALPRRAVYVDIDPGFTQCWHQAGLDARLSGHDAYFTIGANIGSDGCGVPTGGLDWQLVRQPVVLSDWPVVTSPPTGRFTTVGSWRGAFGALEIAGRRYGQKAHEFRKFIDLPQRVADVRFEVALDIHPADRGDSERLRDHGWDLVDPREVAGHPETFRDYVQGSGAEFSVAQEMYVETAGGWFSDRSVRYLAAGRPVLVQDTGFSRTLPTGEGLLSFRTIEEAVEGVRAIRDDPERHGHAARAIAETFFDADVVLPDFLARVEGGRA